MKRKRKKKEKGEKGGKNLYAYKLLGSRDRAAGAPTAQKWDKRGLLT